MPILAFSDEGTLTEEDIMNHPSIKWLYDEYRNEVKWAIENLPDKPSSEYSRMSSTRAGNYVIEIQPLLQYDNDRRTNFQTLSVGVKISLSTVMHLTIHTVVEDILLLLVVLQLVFLPFFVGTNGLLRQEVL